MDSKTSLDYLNKELPELRERYAWAPNLYAAELAHIDAISALAEWVGSDSRSDDELTDVLNQFARAHGWSAHIVDQSEADTHG